MMDRPHIPWRTGRAHALIVGTAGDERSTITRLLAAQNIAPATADGFEGAIEVLSDGQFDIVVSDIALKGRSEGVGLARWILQHQPQTAIILLADTFPWFPANSLVAAVPVLIRPINPRILLEKVRETVPASGARDVA
jgi:DNA-binding NtrC family response regulator